LRAQVAQIARKCRVSIEHARVVAELNFPHLLNCRFVGASDGGPRHGA
jgi:hypothetical protein